MLFIVGGLHGTQGNYSWIAQHYGFQEYRTIRRDYLIPAFRQLDIDVVRGNYLEYTEALLQMFMEGN